MSYGEGNPHYYNEFDPFAAAWLRELIRAGELPAGDVDERSIVEVQASDLEGYMQCHFFAGIGGWPLALRLAGVGPEVPLWTGSCPCPPFSAAGKKKLCPQCGGKRPVPCPRRTGFFICCLCEHAWFADERHLWPEVWRLIRDGEPSDFLGEQVAGADGRIWFAGVRASAQLIGYAAGAVDLAAAGTGEETEVAVFDDDGSLVHRGTGIVGPPHIRQRIFYGLRRLADSRQFSPRDDAAGQGSGADSQSPERRTQEGGESRRHRCSGGLADAGRSGNERRLRPREASGANDEAEREAREREWRRTDAGCGGRDGRLEHATSDGRQQGRPESVGRCSASGCSSGGMGHTVIEGLEGHAGDGDHGHQPGRFGADTNGSVAAAGSGGGDAWSDFRIVHCRDRKARRIESSTQPLAHGVPGRVGLLRGYGNAIVPQVAAEFIKAYFEAAGEMK